MAGQFSWFGHTVMAQALLSTLEGSAGESPESVPVAPIPHTSRYAHALPSLFPHILTQRTWVRTPLFAVRS